MTLSLLERDNVATFGSYPIADLANLRAELKGLTSECPTLRDAGQICVDRLHQEFAESLALIRLFATVPFAFLPEREQAFARRLATERKVQSQITEDTIVLTLLASRGSMPEWNDPRRSRHHLAIPVLSASFIQTIPLVSRVLAETGIVPWLEKQSTLIMLKTVGEMAQLIYVEAARTSRTSDGFHVIPSQDFVQAHDIRTVLALGGSYLNGTAMALLLFTTEHFTEGQAAKFTPLVNTIKTMTMKAVMDCKIL